VTRPAGFRPGDRARKHAKSRDFQRIRLCLSSNKNIYSLLPTQTKRPNICWICWELESRGRWVSRHAAAGFDLFPHTRVSGLTTMSDCFHPDQNLRAKIHKTLSNTDSLGLACLRFNTASCWRRAKFSSRSPRRLWNDRRIAPATRRWTFIVCRCYRTPLVEHNAVSC
jgi:hypothetical protein